MTQISITTNAQIVRQGLEDLAAEIPKIGRLRIYRTMQRIQKRMRKPGKAVRYPIKWDSEKQKRAFFATNGFGRGIPTARTGAYQAGWEIKKLDTGYQMVTSVGYSKYVGGDAYGQVHSGIHKGRYELLRDVVDDEVASLPAEVEDEIKLVAKRKGF